MRATTRQARFEPVSPVRPASREDAHVAPLVEQPEGPESRAGPGEPVADGGRRSAVAGQRLRQHPVRERGPFKLVECLGCRGLVAEQPADEPGLDVAEWPRARRVAATRVPRGCPSTKPGLAGENPKAIVACQAGSSLRQKPHSGASAIGRSFASW